MIKDVKKELRWYYGGIYCLECLDERVPCGVDIDAETDSLSEDALQFAVCTICGAKPDGRGETVI